MSLKTHTARHFKHFYIKGYEREITSEYNNFIGRSWMWRIKTNHTDVFIGPLKINE